MTYVLRCFSAVFAFSMLATAVHGDTPGFCSHYASQAVWQFNQNRSIPGCFHGADGTWHPDYGRHYGWCIVASHAAVEQADTYRGTRIHQCRLRAYGHP